MWWRAGDRLAEPVVGAYGTASWHQGFRHQSITKIAPETRFWATPVAPPPLPLLTALPPRKLPSPPSSSVGSHWAGSSRPCKHLDGAHSSPSRGPAPHSAAWPPRPHRLPREVAFELAAPSVSGGSSPLCLCRLSPRPASSTEQCPQCRPAGPPRREADPAQPPEARGRQTQTRWPLPRQPADPVGSS